MILIVCRQAAKLLPKNLAGGAKGLGQDVLTNIRLLDTFCYNNVFIDEGLSAPIVRVKYPGLGIDTGALLLQGGRCLESKSTRRPLSTTSSSPKRLLTSFWNCFPKLLEMVHLLGWIWQHTKGSIVGFLLSFFIQG